MIPFQERKKIRKIMYSRITLVLLLVVFVIVGRGAFLLYQKAKIAHRERDLAVQTYVELEKRNIELSASLTRLKSDKGIEEEIRHKYMVARHGEEVVVVVDENLKKSKNEEIGVISGFWARFVSFFTL